MAGILCVIRIATLVLAGTTAAQSAESGGLSRKPMTGPDESYPGVVATYDSLRDAAGQRLRLILTHPQASPEPVATIFVVGWLSCDSVAAPPGTRDAPQLVFQSLAQLPGFATVRMDKPGTGDSEGDCSATDFTTELTDYRAAFRSLHSYPFIDPKRIFILGISNGGGFAPLVAEGAPVRGYVTDGGWLKTWFEHMMEIERRRLTLEGRAAADINTAMKSVAALYSAYLIEGTAPQQIFARQPALKDLWEGDAQHQYGRPVAYYQQLQQLNLMAAWSEVKVPTLVLHGEFDWIMSRSDLELMTELVNRNLAGAATFAELPMTGHAFDHYASMKAAFAGQALPFDPSIARKVSDWFQQHR